MTRGFFSFFCIPYQSNTSLKKQKSSVQSLLLVWRKMTVLMHGNLFHITVYMGALRLKVFILINHKVQWYMLTHSESTLLLQLCIDSLSGVQMSVINFIIKFFSFMKQSVSVHHCIIQTGLKDVTPMLLSIKTMVHFVFNA